MRPDLTWRRLTGVDLPEVTMLATRCLAADGGLPLIASESFLGRWFAAPDGVTRGAVDRSGRLVGAAALRPPQGAHQGPAAYLGLVDPAHRERGIGSVLLDWGLAGAAATGNGIVVETGALTEAAAALFAARGLHRTFAEDVLRFDLVGTTLPAIAVPAGIRLDTWSAALAPRFFAVYAAAFAERPRFPGWSAERWIDWTSDEDFRPGWSVLATDATGADVAFVTCAKDWIVQVGVRPAQRGRGLGAALLVEAMRRMRADAARAVLLDVNVDNAAGRLYRRLGFTPVGRRARFEPAR